MINLNELTSHHPAFHNIVASHLPHTFAGSPASNKTFKKWFAGGPQAPKPFKSDLREPRKHQNL